MMKNKIESIISDNKLGVDAKIEKLLVLRNDCRSAQRAVTEGGMTGDDGLSADLTLVDNALDEIGFDLENRDQGAATL